MARKIASSCLSLIIGCGYTSQREMCRCDQVLAFDIDKERIFQARRKDRRAHYAVCDARFLPLRSGHFEDVVCTDVLEHIADYEKVLLNIIRLKPRFIYLRYPTETREKLLIRASRVYREQHWGKIHVTIVGTKRVTDILDKKGYEARIELTSATSTFNRLILQSLLEKLRIRYRIPDLGLVEFFEERALNRFLVFISRQIGILGNLTHLLWKYLRIATIHDNYIVRAALQNLDHSDR
jgi:hypothetical protein